MPQGLCGQIPLCLAGHLDFHDGLAAFDPASLPERHSGRIFPGIRLGLRDLAGRLPDDLERTLAKVAWAFGVRRGGSIAWLEGETETDRLPLPASGR